VIPAAFDYLRPATVLEALEMTALDADAMFLAGGHALLPERKLRHAAPLTLIDLGRVAELHGISIHEDGAGEAVRIGAMTTSAEIEYSPYVARVAPLLPRAAAVISDPLIRNRATLGGSLAEADPHGDWPPVVLAADATMYLRSSDSERALPASEFLATDGDAPGGKRTALRPRELLTAVSVPAAGARTRSTYLKRMHPASGHAMLGVAVVVTFDADETCRECRIAVTGTATVATRARRAEDRLAGSRLSLDAIDAAADAANDGIAFSGDAFGSAAYLAELLPIYVSRALSQIATTLNPN
jgi:aerobic carbon-monoxide dehydrogenase medium subunit